MVSRWRCIVSVVCACCFGGAPTEISVSDKPEARILLGASLIPDSIREGADVYFDCIVEAQPSVYKVEWKHNVSIALFIQLIASFQVKVFINSP